jgi:hypothetical protein
MNEEKPKSIWKKSWPSPWWLRAWLITSGATFLILLVISQMLPGGPKDASQWLVALTFFLVASLTVAAVVIFLWSFIRWLFCRRNLKRTLFTLACFVTLIALFYAEENWRGKHDWNKFKRAWEAKGERFDWQSIVPSPVPDDQNFAFSPVWIAEDKLNFRSNPKRAEAWYGDRIYSDEVAKLLPLLPVSTSTVVGTNIWRFHSPPDNSGTWAAGEFLDLKPFQTYYRDVGKTNPAAQIIIAPQPQTPAQDVLLALSKFDPVIEQLRRDSAKPYSRFPLQYDDENKGAILLPHLAAEKRIAQVLQLRAVAELQNGENEKALDDVKLTLRLVGASHGEPFLICHLVRIAIFNYALQPIWESLANHQWSNAQLTSLDSELAKLDFLADSETAIRGERNLEIADIEFAQRPHDLGSHRSAWSYIAPIFHILQGWSDDSDSSPGGFQMFALALGPSGWLDQNELRLARFNTKWYLPVVDEKAKTISPAKMRAANDALRQEIQHRTPENVLETLFIPNWNNAAEKFAHAQTSANLARVALALERYRLANGNYPESLDALAPKFISEIPHDVIGGESLKYRRDSINQFVLYSVGWNERDDGGVVVFKKGSSPRDETKTDVDISEGDWVWRYPQTE